MRKNNFNTYLPFIICASIFIGIKFQTLGVRLSDTNIYFLTAKELLNGKILYRDIFFTNFPLIPYIASVYYLISGGNLIFYYFTATLEILATAFIMYYIVLKESKSKLNSTTILILYLFSFLLLSTSDHQTGVFLAALFSVISYFFFTKQKYLLVGIFCGLAILTKAYSLPLLLSYSIFYFLTKRDALTKFILGGCATLIVLLPSIIFAPHAFYQNVFYYSLTRSEGVGKTGIIYFLLQHDFIFTTMLIVCTMLAIKSRSFFSLFAIFSLVFFLFYKDVYYLYLNVTLPLIILAYPTLIDRLKGFQINRFMIPTLVLIYTLYNLFTYFRGFTDLQKIPSSQIISTLHKNHISSIYGVNGIAPAISYLGKIPLLNNVIDTNDNIYRKGYLSASEMTKDAIKNHSAVISTGAWYPQANIKEDVLTEIIDKKELAKNCHILKRFPFHSEGVINSINIFSC